MNLTTCTPNSNRYGDIPAALCGSNILITGAAGLVGTQLLHRLLCDSSFAIDRVIAIIRAETREDAIMRLPPGLRCFTRQEPLSSSSPKLVVLNGDCSKLNFGLASDQLELARQAEIVINAAADTRFTLPLSDAIGGVVCTICATVLSFDGYGKGKS